MRNRSLLTAFLLLALPSVFGCQRMIASSETSARAFSAQMQLSGLQLQTVGERKNPRQIVILLHGWGAPGDDLVPLGEALSAPGRLFVFPEAPLVSPGGGRAWWHLDVTRIQAARDQGQKRDLRSEQPEGMAEASAQVRRLLDELRQRAPEASVIIGGFSQGAMLSTDVTLEASSSLAGLVVMSGTVVNEARWAPSFKALRSGFPIFISHGRGDAILPFELAEALRDHASTGMPTITWLPFDGGHEIPMPVLARLRGFLGSR